MSIKITTKIVGLAVIPNAREVLCSIYNKTLSVLSEMPEKCAYRLNTERIVKGRLKIASVETEDSKIEARIKQGQMEELVDQAKREFSLSEKMLNWEPWKPSLGPPPPGQWNWPV